MRKVNICPRNPTELERASDFLGCGSDEYGNNQYMCLPNAEKTSLFEFCYDGLMGMKEKGTFSTLIDTLSRILCWFSSKKYP